MIDCEKLKSGTTKLIMEYNELDEETKIKSLFKVIVYFYYIKKLSNLIVNSDNKEIIKP